MGKKAKLKQIRRIAAQMPEIKINSVIGERVSGAELYKEGIKKVGDEPIDANATYSRRNVIERPLNHNRNMKQLYNQYGAVGVNIYMTSIKNHVASQVQKVEEALIPEGRKLQNEEI